MPHVRIYHNPKCSKSRQTLALLQAHGIEPEIIEYLKTPPSADDLQSVLTALGLNARDIIRSKETVFKELSLSDSDEASLIAAMVKHPVLIERPIVIKDNRAVIGRPPENVLELIA